MLFKSASTFGRTAAAAKAMWVTHSAQPVPGFFISTPQFQRQRSQVGPYLGDARRYSNGVDTGYFLSFPGGPNFSSGGAVSSLDDDEREARAALAPLRRPIPDRVILRSQADSVHAAQATDSADAADAESAIEIVDISTDELQAEVREEIQTQADLHEDLITPQIEPALELGSIDETAARIANLQRSGDHHAVLSTFSELEHTGTTIPISIYNQVLASLASIGIEAGDLSTLLQAYEHLLQQGIPPNKDTYSILVDSLRSNADRLAARKSAVALCVGVPEDRLESVIETLETFDSNDHIRLAIAIFKASVSVDASNYDQATLDKLVESCASNGVEAPELLEYASPAVTPAVLKLHPDFKAFYRSLEMPSHATNIAYLECLVQIGQISDAVQFYNTHLQAGSAEDMLAIVINGFARDGKVATALRWIRQQDNRLSVEELCTVLNSMCSGVNLESPDEVLPSASLLYETIAIHAGLEGNREFDLARNAYISLCVQAGHEEALMAVIKESSLRNALWSPSTISSVLEFCVSKGEVKLALDLFVHQSSKLATAWQAAGVETFIGQELLDDALTVLEPTFNSKDGIEYVVRLIQVPFISKSFGARYSLLSRIWQARKELNPALINALNSSSVLLLNLIALHSKWIVDSESHMGLAIPHDQAQDLREMYPLLVSDLVENNIVVSSEVAATIEKCIRLLEVDPRPWTDYVKALGEMRLAAAKTSTLRFSESNALIVSYANTENGLDESISLMEHALLAGELPSEEAFKAVLLSCLRIKSVAHLEKVNEFAERYLPLPDVDPVVHDIWIAFYRVLVKAAKINYPLAQHAHQELLKLNSAPTASGYALLLLHSPDVTNKGSIAAMLFNEARSRNVTGNTLFYNSVLSHLTTASRYDDVDFVFAEMERLEIPRSMATFNTALIAALKRDRVDNAMALLNELPTAYDYVASANPYNLVMDYFVHKQKSRSEALKVFDELRETKTVLNTQSYRLLMEAWLLAPMNLQEADKVLAMMKEDGVAYDTKHFAELLRARGVLAKDLNAARDFYRGLVKNSRVLPDQHIFRALMDSYVANGRTKETPQVLDEMAKYHVPVTQPIFDALIRGWSKSDPLRAQELISARNASA